MANLDVMTNEKFLVLPAPYQSPLTDMLFPDAEQILGLAKKGYLID
jgi:hypothetical protein